MSQESKYKQQAIEYLVSGASSEQTAKALGVSPSLISSWLSEDAFKLEITERKYEAMKKHVDRDAKIDALEDRVLEQLDKASAYMSDPMKLLNVFTRLNAAKRRGPEVVAPTTGGGSTVVQLSLPKAITANFQINGQSQVVQVGTQNLTTIGSSSMKELAQKTRLEAEDVIPFTLPTINGEPAQRQAARQATSTAATKAMLTPEALGFDS